VTSPGIGDNWTHDWVRCLSLLDRGATVCHPLQTHGMRVRRRPSRVGVHLEMGNACIAVDEVVVVFGVEHRSLEVVTGEAPDAVE